MSVRLIAAITAAALATSSVFAQGIVTVHIIGDSDKDKPRPPVTEGAKRQEVMIGGKLHVIDFTGNAPTTAQVDAFVRPPKKTLTLDEKLKASGLTRQDIKDALK